MSRTLNLALALLLELCMLAALAYWGATVGDGWLVGLVLGIGSPVVAVVLWTFLAAPNSPRRLPQPWLLMFKVVIFGLAALALANAGQSALAVVFALVVAVNLTLAWVWKQ